MLKNQLTRYSETFMEMSQTTWRLRVTEEGEELNDDKSKDIEKERSKT